MRTARAATGPGAGIAGLRRRLQFRARVVWRRRLAVAQFAFAFYGFATYNVLINPSNPAAQTVLEAMITLTSKGRRNAREAQALRIVHFVGFPLNRGVFQEALNGEIRVSSQQTASDRRRLPVTS